MQPGSPERQKLAQLPQPALEALLDNPTLKAASENSAIAAVTFWLEQEEGQMLTKEQKLRLAYKLRLISASPWYLTRIVLKEGHWLHDILSSEQKIVLTAAVHSRADWISLQATGEEVTNARLFGKSDQVGVSWWEEDRPPSSIRFAELLVEISPGELWENVEAQAAKESQAYFYNGITWNLLVKSPLADAKDATSGFHLGAFIKHSLDHEPVAFTGHIEVLGIAHRHTTKEDMGRTVLWNEYESWGSPNMLGTTYTSLEDATAKLARFIHRDGKLHIKGTVTGVL
jgi:hypothetical protein